MLILFQKYHTQLNLLLLALLGLCCGLLAGALLESTIDAGAQRTSGSVPTANRGLAKVTTADLNHILKRNIFDPAARSTYSFTPATRSKAQQATQSSAQQGDRTLFGTVVAEDKSLALIRSGKELAAYHLNDELPDGGKIEEIRRNRVKIRNQDGSLTTLEIMETPTGATAGKAVASETPEIRKIDEDRWLIPRETAEATRQNLAEELRLAQMQPRIVDGQTNGFMIRSIKRRSLLNKLGLRRGDVIMAVNEMALDSPEKALQIFQQLREARQINVAVERKGEAMTFAYELD